MNKIKKMAKTFQWIWIVTSLLNLVVDFVYQPDFKLYPWNLIKYLFYLGIGFGICGLLIDNKIRNSTKK